MKTLVYACFALLIGALVACSETSSPDTSVQEFKKGSDLGPLGGDGPGPKPDGKKPPWPGAKGPASYFMAIHGDPFAPATDTYLNLVNMVKEADARGLKLTVMLTAQWADYLTADPTRKAAVSSWAATGHEIALHHHSVYHGAWDQYSDFSYDEYAAIMGEAKAAMKEKLGSLDDMVAKIQELNPSVSAGCGNDESDKSVLPDVIVKDACPGFYTSNAFPLGTRADGGDPQAGVNDFVLVGTTENGIERRWLNHGIIGGKFYDGTLDAFNAMKGGAHGVVVHTNDHDLDTLTKWMDALVDYDAGAGTDTLSGILDKGDLPEKELTSDLVNKIYLDAPEEEDDGPPGAK